MLRHPALSKCHLKCCPTRPQCCSDSRTSSPCCTSSGWPGRDQGGGRADRPRGSVPGVWGADIGGEGTPSRPAQRPARLGAAGRAVVAQASAGVPGDAVSAAIVHPDLYCGAAAWPGHRTAPRSGGDGDRVVEPGRVRRRRRVRRVLADRAPGADRRGGPLATRAGPTRVLGIDETRFRTVRWILDGISWKRSDPWLTSFVDCSTDGPGSLLGLAPGRTGGCVQDWLAEQTPEFRHSDRTPW